MKNENQMTDEERLAATLRMIARRNKIVNSKWFILVKIVLFPVALLVKLFKWAYEY